MLAWKKLYFSASRCFSFTRPILPQTFVDHFSSLLSKMQDLVLGVINSFPNLCLAKRCTIAF